MRTIACFVILLIFVFALSAQENSSPKHDSTATNEPKYFLSEIIVTAPRSSLPLFQVPNSIQVLDREDIQRGEIGLSLEESLRSVPGVLVNNRNNLSQGDRISIRGIGSRASFGVRGIKVMDANAFGLCKENGIPIVVMNINEPGAIARVVRGERVGTLVQ